MTYMYINIHFSNFFFCKLNMDFILKESEAETFLKSPPQFMRITLGGLATTKPIQMLDSAATFVTGLFYKNLNTRGSTNKAETMVSSVLRSVNFPHLPYHLKNRKRSWTDLAHILHVLKLPQLREGVVSQGFVQWSVTVLICQVQIGTFSHK